MKKCELETRSRPKKAKQYVYVKECNPVTRQVCSYKPDEQCKEKKEYCYKVEKKVCVAEKKEIVDNTFNYV